MKFTSKVSASLSLAIALLAAGPAGQSPSIAEQQPASSQAVVCEYRVPVGVGAYRHSQYTFFETQFRYFAPGSLVWASPTIVINSANHYDFSVRELAGSGGGWARAELLRRTGAKCHELR